MIHGGTVGAPVSGRDNSGGGDQGGGDIFPLPSEHYGPVYCNSSNTGAMPVDGMVDGRTGTTTRVL